MIKSTALLFLRWGISSLIVEKIPSLTYWKGIEREVIWGINFKSNYIKLPVKLIYPKPKRLPLYLKG
jgi:hypothetical protein